MFLLFVLVVGRGPLRRRIECNCKHGTAHVPPKDGPNCCGHELRQKCAHQNAQVCTSCDEGYAIEDDFDSYADTYFPRCVAACKCQSGSPSGRWDCPGPGAESCNNCNEGFHQFQPTKNGRHGRCVHNECSCKHGEPSKGKGCKKHHGKACKSCNKGYHLDETKTHCKVNMCTCHQGRQALKEQCTTHETEHCVEYCNPGWTLDTAQRICKANRCECLHYPHGDPNNYQYEWTTHGEGGIRHFKKSLLKNDVCPRRGQRLCFHCRPGFALDGEGTGNSCKGNVCTCDHGKPAEGADCDVSGKKCASCDDMYRLAGTAKGYTPYCKAHICECAHGKAPSPCETDGAKLCASCDAGFHMDNIKCIANVCSCGENGTPAQGAACETDGANICSACDAGFHMEGTTCKENSCGCDFGSPAQGTACTSNNAKICASCNTGWTLDAGACAVNECSCGDGLAKQGDACTTHNAEMCESCDAGFHLDGAACAANVCECAEIITDPDGPGTYTVVGFPAEGPACETDGANICASCIMGFDYDGTVCTRSEWPHQKGQIYCSSSKLSMQDERGVAYLETYARKLCTLDKLCEGVMARTKSVEGEEKRWYLCKRIAPIFKYGSGAKHEKKFTVFKKPAHAQVCCEYYNAECLACQQKKSVSEVCNEKPTMNGCTPAASGWKKQSKTSCVKGKREEVDSSKFYDTEIGARSLCLENEKCKGVMVHGGNDRTKVKHYLCWEFKKVGWAEAMSATVWGKPSR